MSFPTEDQPVGGGCRAESKRRSPREPPAGRCRHTRYLLSHPHGLHSTDFSPSLQDLREVDPREHPTGVLPVFPKGLDILASTRGVRGMSMDRWYGCRKVLMAYQSQSPRVFKKCLVLTLKEDSFDRFFRKTRARSSCRTSAIPPRSRVHRLCMWTISSSPVLVSMATRWSGS